MSTAAHPPDAAPDAADAGGSPPAASAEKQRRSWSDRLHSPTLREISIGLAVTLVGGVVAFGAREVWGLLHEPSPSGTIVNKDAVDTVDAFVSRGDFYRRFVHEPAPASSADRMGAVFLVQTETHHASHCSFLYTARDVGDQQTVGDLVDEPVEDVNGGSGCGGQTRLWIPWPCVPSETRLQFELDLAAGSKQLDSAKTEVFTIGGSC